MKHFSRYSGCQSIDAPQGADDEPVGLFGDG